MKVIVSELECRIMRAWQMPECPTVAEVAEQLGLVEELGPDGARDLVGSTVERLCFDALRYDGDDVDYDQDSYPGIHKGDDWTWA